jgi:hypothetical protein
METCSLVNVLLTFVVLGFIFALGYIGGIPKWYKDVRTNRMNCVDVTKTKDPVFWQNGAPVTPIDKAAWDMTMYIQGHDPQFQINLDAKLKECSD